MIELHTLSRESEAFHVNPDLIERIEASPDCHIWLTTGSKLAVIETVDEVVAAIRKYRVDILARALLLAK
jgi:flagellar protein FlbD